MRFLLLCLLFVYPFFSIAQEKLVITKLDDVFEYANRHSNVFDNASQQNLLARYQVLAARVGAINLKGDANLSLINNTTLPVSFIPAEIFGGLPGTFRQVQFGQQYITNAAFSPQLDLINPALLGRIKIAKSFQQLTATNALINKKNLFESLAACYFNLESIQKQIEITQQNLANTDTLLRIFSNKHNEGIIRKQELNNALSSQMLVRDRLQQLQTQYDLQLGNLILLCDMPISTIIEFKVLKKAPQPDLNLTANETLASKQSYWQAQYQQSILKADTRWFMPTLSVVANFGWNQNTNKRFFDGSKFFETNYVGLRMMMPIIPDVNKMANVKYDRINLQIAKNNHKHAMLQDSLTNLQLNRDYQSAQKSLIYAKQIEFYANDTYLKNLELFKAGLIGTTELINAFNESLSSSLSFATKQANADFAASKIYINNQIK